ncbi:MAG: hypothetical protein PSV13_16090 [Lacunisphaera sp.]|nr:hypothetical protein [Lacunisphaera sp.]
MKTDILIIPVIALMALAVWLEYRRNSVSVQVELRRVRVLLCVLAAAVVILGLSELRHHFQFSFRLERVEKAMQEKR